MPESSGANTLAQYLSDVALAIAIAVAGGLAKLLQSEEPLTARRVVTGILTSAFCGVIVALVLGEYSYGQLLRAAGIGLSGWAGPAILPIVTDKLKIMAAKYSSGIFHGPR